MLSYEYKVQNLETAGFQVKIDYQMSFKLNPEEEFNVIHTHTTEVDK
jgi:hypothetical protein